MKAKHTWNFEEKERRPSDWSVAGDTIVEYEAIGEAGGILLRQSEDLGFYSSALGNHWTSEALTRSDLHFEKITLAIIWGMYYRKTRMETVRRLVNHLSKR